METQHPYQQVCPNDLHRTYLHESMRPAAAVVSEKVTQVQQTVPVCQLCGAETEMGDNYCHNCGARQAGPVEDGTPYAD